MKFIVFFVFTLSLLQANDVAFNRGETLFFSKACSSCHGPDAQGTTTYPKLANKKESYLTKRLRELRAGKADTVSAQMMAQFARKLSDQNIADLAHFLSHHPKPKVSDLDDDILGGVGS